MSLSSFFLSDKRPVFLKNIRCRPMFGGHGYYINGKMFALVREKSLYLKAGSNNVADFLLTGQLPYIHQCFGEYFPTNFYSVPLNIVEDEVQLTPVDCKGNTPTCSSEGECESLFGLG